MANALAQPLRPRRPLARALPRAVAEQGPVVEQAAAVEGLDPAVVARVALLQAPRRRQRVEVVAAEAACG